MKKFISFLLAAVLLVSAVPTALATNDYSQGTQVVYQATGSESYTITVPALLAPGSNGTVTLQGTWADNRIVNVTADPTVTLTNSIKADDQKVLNVHFDGISEAGSNTTSQTFTQGISVDGITNALFGTWSGKFNYNVELVENTTSNIPVTATDSQGNNLNATSSAIIGDKKTDLLSKLEESGLVDSAENIDALIEIESDDFDNLASTTFNVSSIASEGDTVVILHFNETTQQWEYISEETVDAIGNVTADFSSYSPVAFVVVKSDGSTEIIETETPIATFTDGTSLTWEELKLEENGTKYSYNASLINDTTISNKAFAHCQSLESIILPDSITTIGEEAFLYCMSLKNITLPDTVTIIGRKAFSNCQALTNITIPDGITTIEALTFNLCTKLTSIDLSRCNNLTTIDGSAFSICSSLESIIIPDSVTVIGGTAFNGCAALKSIDLSGCTNLTKIEKTTFYRCTSLENIILPNSITTIGEEAFYDCSSLKSINIPNNIVSISQSAFYGCNALTSIDLGGCTNLTKIEDSTFDSCTSLESIILPEGLTIIGQSAFYYCTSLTNIIFKGTVEQWDWWTGSFNGIELGSSWNYKVPATVVHCSDGDVTIS